MEQPSAFFRVFWPNRAEYMALPTDPRRRSSSRCPGRVVDAAHTAIVTVVTDAWSDADDGWRVDAMAETLQQQSYLVPTWWVLFLAPGGVKARDLEPSRQASVKALMRGKRRLFEAVGATVVVGSGADLVRAMREAATRRGGGDNSNANFGTGRMPQNVLLDTNFNAIFEHTALEKMVWALEAHAVDAVASWSVAIDRGSRSQRLVVRTPPTTAMSASSTAPISTFMARAGGPGFWRVIESRVAADTIHGKSDNLTSIFLCDRNGARVHVLKEYLYWEQEAKAEQKDKDAEQHADAAAAPTCTSWWTDNNKTATDVIALATWRQLTRPLSMTPPSPSPQCPQKIAASLMLLIPWLEYGGADQFNVNLVRNLARPHNIHVIVVTTTDGSDQPLFGDVAAVTSDVFHLNYMLPPPHESPKGKSHTLRLADAVKYLAMTRGIDVLLLSNSEPGYLNLPEIRPRLLPGVRVVDYVHSVALDWRGGGYARYSLENQQWVDQTLVSWIPGREQKPCTSSTSAWTRTKARRLRIEVVSNGGKSSQNTASSSNLLTKWSFFPRACRQKRDPGGFSRSHKRCYAIARA
jgi:hypothetical protein